MKKIICIACFSVLFFSSCDTAQQILKDVSQASPSGLTNDDIISGLREALIIGSQNSSNQLSSLDGFF